MALPVVALFATPSSVYAASLSLSETDVALADNPTPKVTITNETARPLSLTLAIVDEDGKPVKHATATAPEGGVLGPGASWSTTISEPAGPVSSTLNIVAAPTKGLPQGAVARVEISPGRQVAPAVDTWSTIVTSQPSDGDIGVKLPLDGPCADVNLDEAKPLGTLQGDGRVLEVFGSCDEDHERAPYLRLDPRDTHEGTSYGGDLRLGVAKVALTVVATASPWIAGLAILSGLLLALLVTEWTGWGRSAMGLRHRVRELQSRAIQADDGFRQRARQLRLAEGVHSWTIAAGVATLQSQLMVRVRDMRFSGDAKSIAEDIARQLDEAEKAMQGWPTAADQLDQLVRLEHLFRYIPTYFESIRGLTLGRHDPALTIDDMHATTAAAAEALEFLEGWRAADANIYAALEVAQQQSTPEAESVSFDVARIAEAPDRAAVEGRLGQFYDDYRKLVASKPREAASGLDIVASEASSRSPSPGGVVRGHLGPVALRSKLGSALWNLILALWSKFGRAVVDFGVLCLLLALALYTGMAELWLDEAFGDFWDYAGALMWGLGSGATTVALLNSPVGDAWRSWALRSSS